jgi:hypothetical protein
MVSPLRVLGGKIMAELQQVKRFNMLEGECRGHFGWRMYAMGQTRTPLFAIAVERLQRR